MYFGAAYYPEHWPRERWPLDARMMREAGFSMVRMGEFAWTRLEPWEEHFDFGWLDEAIALLGEHGIRTLLGTPTATPPAWVVEQSPEILPIEADGRLVNFGGRRHYCPSHPVYREHTERIVRAMGVHYADNPHVAAWQIDNEFGCHMEACFCDSCQAAFQLWLAQQYGTLEALNAAWGTDFWSQVYTDWTQIPAPRHTSTQHSPSLVLAWKRFYTDLWTDYYQFQARLLRESGVTTPLTTNLMGFFGGSDYATHARALDFVAWDNYPLFSQDGHYVPAMAADLTRSVGGGKPFWVVEQQSGVGGWETVWGRTQPGEVRLNAYQAIAHGAETMLFFRWRSCRFGVEQYWHGILQHDGRPNWRYEEVQRMGAELHKLPADLFTATTPAKAAVLYSTDQLWAHQTQPHAKGFDYLKQCLPAYHGLRDAGIDVDIVNEESDLSGYRLLIAPAWQLVPADAAEAVIDFVRNGGTAVFTFRTGVKDWDGVIFADPLPGPLRDLLGITIDDYDALGSKSATAIVQANHPALPAAPLSGTIWADVITAEDAEVAATFADQWYAGRPAITVNRFGRGQAWYIGASLGGDLWTPLVRHLLAQAALPAVRVSEGVEVSHREGDRLYTFALNMRNAPGWIELDAPMTDLLTGEVVGSGRVAIEGFGVRVLV